MNDKLIRVTSLIVAAVLMWEVSPVIRLAVKLDEMRTSRTIIVLVVLVLVIGLIKQYRWALRITAYIILLTAFCLPGMIFNPFAAGDYMRVGLEPPGVSQTLVWLIPLEILLLAGAYILDPRKEKTTL